MTYISTFAAIVTAELRRVRCQAGLSQAELAERMGIGQASIARMEHDTRGSFSLRRIVDYALACGYIPCNLCDIDEIRKEHSVLDGFHCIPVEDVRAFTIGDPQNPLTWRNYVQWKVSEIMKDMGPPQYPSTPICKVEMAA